MKQTSALGLKAIHFDETAEFEVRGKSYDELAREANILADSLLGDRPRHWRMRVEPFMVEDATGRRHAGYWTGTVTVYFEGDG